VENGQEKDIHLESLVEYLWYKLWTTATTAAAAAVDHAMQARCGKDFVLVVVVIVCGSYE
jgi:hypothetical protein